MADYGGGARHQQRQQRRRPRHGYGYGQENGENDGVVMYGPGKGVPPTISSNKHQPDQQTIGKARVVYRGRVKSSNNVGVGVGEARSGSDRIGKAAPNASSVAPSGKKKSGSGRDEDFLAQAGIQLSDRQRQLRDRRKGPKEDVAPSAAAAMPSSSAASPSIRTAQRSSSSSAKDRTGTGTENGLKRSSRSKRNTSKSPKRPTMSRSSSAQRSSRSALGNLDGNSPKRPSLAAAAATRSSSARRSSRSVLGNIDGNSPMRSGGGGRSKSMKSLTSSGSSLGLGGGDGGGKGNAMERAGRKRLSPKKERGTGSEISSKRSSVVAGIGTTEINLKKEIAAKEANIVSKEASVKKMIGVMNTESSKSGVADKPPNENVAKVTIEKTHYRETKAVPSIPNAAPSAPSSAPVISALASALPLQPAAQPGILRKSTYTQQQRGGPLATVTVGAVTSSSVTVGVDQNETNPSYLDNVKEATILSNNNCGDSDSDQSAGFVDFLNDLKEEVAPDHTELWSGFQSAFGISSALKKPLHSEFEAEASNTSNPSRRKPTKKRLRPRAQEKLSKIHQHLLNSGHPEDYAGSSQLMNDRKVFKERAKRNQNSVVTTGAPPDPRPATFQHTPLKSAARKTVRMVEQAEKEAVPIPSAENRLTMFAGRTPAAPRVAARSKIRARNTNTNDLPPQTNQIDSDVGSGPKGGKDERVSGKSEETQKKEESNDHGSVNAPQPPSEKVPAQCSTPAKVSTATSVEQTPVQQKPAWLLKLQERQKQLKEKESTMQSSSSLSPLSVEKDPIEKLFGKRVVSTRKKKRPAESPLERPSGSENTPQASMTPLKFALRPTPAKSKKHTDAPWQVKLRETPLKQRSVAPVKGEDKEEVKAVPFAIGLKKTGFFEKQEIRDPYSKRVAEPTEQWNPSSKVKPKEKRRNGGFEMPMQSYLTSNQPSYLLQRQPWLKPSDLKPVNAKEAPLSPSHTLGILFGDTIDIANLPEDSLGPQNDATIVELSSHEDYPTSVVIIGKDAVVKATRISKDEAKGDGKDLATIAWCWHRADIRSLTLNNEATCAELSLKQRSKVLLSFESAEDCITFAQAFYKLNTSNSRCSDEVQDPTDTDEKEESGNEAPTAQGIDTPTERSGSEVGAATARSQSQLEDTSHSVKKGEEDAGEAIAKEDHSSISEIKEQITGGRVLTEEEEFVLQQYREGVITADSVSAAFGSRITGTSGGTDEEPLPSTNANISAAAESDPRADLLQAIKGGVKSKMSKFDTLTDEEATIATKYRKMLSMGVPPPAVQHAMTRDQIYDKIVNAVMNSGNAPEPSGPTSTGDVEGSSDATKSDLTEEDQAVAAKYLKMLKISIPREAVRHKLIRDNVSEKIRIAVLGPDADKSKSSGLSLSDADEQIAAQYRKMLKISIPREAVRNKMMRDNVGVKIIEAVLGKGATAKAEKEIVSITLTSAEEAIASQYKRMIRFNIPKDAVRHKMMKDNVDARIIIAVVGDEGGLMTPHGKKKKNRRGKSMVALHWTPLSPSALEQSVWRTNKKRRLTSSCIPEESDVKKLETMFQKKTNNAKATTGDASKDSDGKGKAKLIDLNRANIIAISLKAFSDFTHEDLALTIEDLDPETKIIGERVQFLTGLLPNQGEIAAVKGYKGNDERLVPAEIFFRHLLSVSRLQNKVHVIQTMATFRENTKEAFSKFQLLGKVCGQVMKSEKLQKVLEMVLHIGNIMNEGTRNGDVDGFKFDSLLKLTQTKSMDGKLTVLDYIVLTFIEKGERASLDIGSDFPECDSASKILISDLLGDTKGLRMGLNKCRTELKSIKTDQSEKRVTRSMASKFEETPSKASDPRADLMAAISGRAKDTSEDPRAALLGAIKARGAATVDEKTAEGDVNSPTKFSPGVTRLENFLAEGTNDLELLEKERNSAVQNCKDLAIYFGEGGGERSAAPLLSVLSTFSKAIKSAIEGYDKRVNQEKKRKEADAKKKQGFTPAKKAALQSTSIVSHNIVSEKRSSDATMIKDEKAGAASSPKGKVVYPSARPILSTANNDSRSENASQLREIKETVGNSADEADGKSLIYAVHDLLQTASPKTRKDFRNGVQYRHAHDKRLTEIYAKENRLAREGTNDESGQTILDSSRSRKHFISTMSNKNDSKIADNEVALLDPRAAMLAAIRSRSGD